MPKETVEIPVPVLSSLENLDELLDWVNITKSEDHG
jgi:hypothetical protein